MRKIIDRISSFGNKKNQDKASALPIAVTAEAFFSVWAVSRACGLTTRNVLSLVFFAVFIIFFRYVSALNASSGKSNSAITASPALSVPCNHTKENPDGAVNVRCIRAASAVTALLFTSMCLLASSSALTAGLDHRLFQAVILSAGGIGFYFLFYYLLYLLFTYTSAFSLSEETLPIRHLPLISFFCCLLGWLPYFLYEYPGIMTPDSINQFEQVLAMVPYSNHHPWAHTMVINFFYSMGRIFTQDINAALAFYTIFQMGFMAFCAAWLIATLQKLRVKNLICILVIAFYSLVPYHGVFAVTIWKDILFSGAVLLFTSALLRLLFFTDGERRTMLFTIFLYILSGIMMCLFRTNGWYAFLFSLPVLLYAFRGRTKLLLLAHFPILAMVLLMKLVIMNAYEVTQPDFVESICIPLQQVARVICEDKELTPAQWESVHKVIDTTYIKELYAPGFADNMKELVRAGDPGYLAENKGEYLHLWASLGLKYPAVYLQAHIDQTIGYWFPDVAYTVGDIDGIIANETGVYSRPLIAGPLVVKTKEILLKLGDIIPLYGLLSSTGFMFWVLLCCLSITVLRKKYSSLPLFLPGLAVILTLFIATPVSSEFRYAYSLACTLPLYIIIPFLPCSRRE